VAGRATTGSGGWYFDTRRDVHPVLFGVTIAEAAIWRAVSQAASAMASSWLLSCHVLRSLVISFGRNF